MSLDSHGLWTWAICALAVAGVILRPWRLPEAIWAVAGAVVLLLAGLIAPADALRAVGKGTDVYLFLAGMMLLSEIGRREGLFDWVAAHAVNWARGSQKRLFLLVYAVGALITGFLSNDACAVVLTPAVYAAAKKAKAEPLPYLFICAFVANAASFVLPISNPANLVLYGGRTPALGPWLGSFLLASLAAILATYAVLRFTQRRALAGPCAERGEVPALSRGGWTALWAMLIAAVTLSFVSALDLPLGLPTFLVGAASAAVVLWRDRASPWPVLKGVSWQVLVLVAGLFVLVEALDRTGLIAILARALGAAAAGSVQAAAAGSGALLAIACNLVNNLPAGLIASSTIARAHPAQLVTDSLLIGVDLGPNLSVTGSLATILWLTALRREGEHVGFWRFLRLGAVVMPPALVLALLARLSLH